MAYTHSKYEVSMQRANPVSGNLATSAEIQGAMIDVTGVAAQWSPGFVPHIIKGAVVHQHTGAPNSNAVHVGFNADISVPGAPTRAFTIVVPTTVTGGTAVFYRPTYYLEVPPGSKVQAAVTAAATAGSAAAMILYVEPRWEEPDNITGMIATT